MPKCDSTVYSGGHDLGQRYFTVSYPDGTVKRFCDSDCLRENFRLDYEDFQAQLRRQRV